MTSLRRGFSIALLLAIYASPVATVHADGKFFALLEAGDEPGIQAQRAVVAFRDGVETLIVQSDVDGSDAAFGWLLPLPAEPTSIEACQANCLKALGAVVQPRVVEPRRSFLIYSIAFMLLILAACLDHIRCSAAGPAKTSAVRIGLAITGVLFLVSPIFLQSLGTGGEFGGSVEVLSTTRAGIYDIAIIKGRTAEGVERWLTSNGFASSPTATAVIGDYVAEDWYFLAARIAPDKSGPVSHHPLKVSFPAKRAVYPMRLTGVGGDPLDLDLYVIAERRAHVAGMKTWSCDTYQPATPGFFDEYVCALPPIYAARHARFFNVGIPDVSSLMWPDCVVTRLHARMAPSRMKDDLEIAWRAPEPVRAMVFSRAGALEWSGGCGAIAVALACVWLTRSAVRRKWSWQEAFRRRILAVMVMGVFAVGLSYVIMDVVPIAEHSRASLRSRVRPLYVHDRALAKLAEAPAGASFPETYCSLVSPSGTGRISEIADPLEETGDYRIDASSDGWRLTILDWQSIPITVLISSNGAPTAAAER